jgi:four helix bundle protein
MRDRERLKVLEAARLFAELCIDLAQALPRSAPAGLRAQLASSAQAVSDILAEGLGRGTVAEKLHYSHMANGSLEESQNRLRRCINRKLIDRKTFYRPWNLSIAISRMLAGLIAHFESENEDH